MLAALNDAALRCKASPIPDESIKQYMAWSNGVKNLLGDKCLHRWKARDLQELLADYEEVK